MAGGKSSLREVVCKRYRLHYIELRQTSVLGWLSDFILLID